MADDPYESIRRLEERLGRASEQAERLIAEAARMGLGDRPPAAGWQSPPPDPEEARGGGELDALIQAIQAFRALVPPDVVDRLEAALRELLLALRVLIDTYLERLDRRPDNPPEVQDIPIR
jgi:hypothetical protein